MVISGCWWFNKPLLTSFWENPCCHLKYRCITLKPETWKVFFFFLDWLLEQVETDVHSREKAIKKCFIVFAAQRRVIFRQGQTILRGFKIWQLSSCKFCSCSVRQYNYHLLLSITRPALQQMFSVCTALLLSDPAPSLNKCPAVWYMMQGVIKYFRAWRLLVFVFWLIQKHACVFLFGHVFRNKSQKTPLFFLNICPFLC